MTKVIMIQGTASNSGKSLLTAGLCRVFKEDGYSVAPFKSQNMAGNSHVTAEGLEMARAQAVQAEAAKTSPSVMMNPILLKPTSDMGSLVILMGEAVGQMAAAEYFAYKRRLRPLIMEAYNQLATQYEIIVIEGAGSPAEINLKEDDIVNMGMAKMADAPVLLLGDIDRGGVFASLYGTLALLTEEERQRVRGLIINKFRGDEKILRPGLKQLEQLTQKPVLGVVPYLDVDVEEEDSLSERTRVKPPYCAGEGVSAAQYREQQYDRLAGALRASLDMGQIYCIMGLPDKLPRSKDCGVTEVKTPGSYSGLGAGN